MSRLVNDLFDISSWPSRTRKYIYFSVKIIGSFISIMLLNVKMTLILLVVTLIMVVFSIHRNFKMEAVFMDNRIKIARVNSSLQDSLAGIRVVKSFANEKVEKQISEKQRELFSFQIQKLSDDGQLPSLEFLFSGLLYIVVIVSGGVSIANGSLRLTELAIYLLYINIFVSLWKS